MSYSVDLQKFKTLPLKDKYYFFENKGIEELINLDSKLLQQFFKKIIQDNDENEYIRKKALEKFINFVMINKIKKRFALNLLVDEWDSSEECFLELTRLRKLFLFYDEDSDEIEQIYLKLSEHDESEIQSECFFQLGLVNFLKANEVEDQKEYICSLKLSIKYFEDASSCIENRTDADFFILVVSMLLAIIQKQEGNNENYLKQIAQLLWQQKIFSTTNEVSHFQVGLYRTLYSFNKIRLSEPSDWLDYKKEFNNLCYYFYEIKNQEVYNELVEGSLLKNVSGNLIRRSIEPIFSINFNAEIIKIDKFLDEVKDDQIMVEFLLYIKKLACDNKVNEEAEANLLLSKIINTFPMADKTRIEKEFEKLKGKTSTQKMLALYDLLSEYTYEKLLDTILYACINLQGNHIYRDKTENERNTFIVSCLDMAGISNKDQTLWGKSNEGKTSGEVDIFVKQKDGRPFSIIEALNLNSLKKTYLNLHLDKIFKYDTMGLKCNFILIYSTSNNFGEFWNRYVEYIKKYDFRLKSIGYQELIGYEYANIKVGKTVHIRNGIEVYLFHIMIDML
ncbi:hypothetical protein [Bacillus sp. UNCCL81]|uniref:hypothetical protein n=1 Tax=Bacillus sp. UNCCL81 TaxID=1502755 RepID=UPI0003FB133C|nr:hypothetical protein [Bacillus sp. UNCCL81]SFD60898.1 hypothetical protein SAMN02799633_04268 [Bacillus sp. UNCCL81]